MNKQEVKALLEYRDSLLAINKLFTLHESQKVLVRTIFNTRENGGGAKTVYAQCGRRWGKTEAGIYIAVRKAGLTPGSQVYIFAPQRNQAKEIYWASGRLQAKIPASLIADPSDFHKTDLRVTFKNGSFIKVDGSDNVNASRGFTPDLVINDEYRDFVEEYLGAVEPALISKDAPMIYLTTPPDEPCHVVEYRDWVLKESQQNPLIKFVHLPTHTNPLIPREWLERKERELRDRGEDDIWKREYLAEDCYSGAKLIFPMFSKHSHVHSEIWMEKAVEKDKKKLYWIASCDPGTSTCFAVLFLAYNPYTGQFFIFDEIYETNRTSTSTNQIYPLMVSKMKALHQGDWTIIHDDAAAWFGQELLSQYSVGAFPAGKGLDKKENRISLLKDLLLQKGMVNVSENCENYISEMSGYRTTVSGVKVRILKDKDHLVDCSFYALAFLNATSSPSKTYDELDKEDVEWGVDLFDNEGALDIWN